MSVKVPTPKTQPDRLVSVPATVGSSDTSPAPPPLGKTRADFRDAEFTRTIRQHPKIVRWSKAMPCPCQNAKTQQPELRCPLCGGSGYAYVDPLDIPVLLLSQDKRTRMYERFGMWVEGGAMVTSEAQYRLAYMDRLVVLDSVMSRGELLTKGNRRGSRKGLGTRQDAARFRIVGVTHVVLREGELAVQLEEGVHFSVTEDGYLRWSSAGDERVPDGAVLSLHYDFHPSYLVISHPHVVRDDMKGTKVQKDTFRSLPIQAAVRLEFLVDATAALSPPTVSLEPA